MDILREIARPRLNRRDFLKLAAATATLMGLSEKMAPQVAQAMEEGAKKKPIVWLEGHTCTGCTESAISGFNPGPAELVLDLLSFRFHDTIMAASGHQAVQALQDAVAEGGYILVVEGAVPTADDRYCYVEGRPFNDVLREAAANAEAIVAVGACASYGGIPAASEFTRAKGIDAVIKDKPVVKIPQCPVKAENLVGTIMYYLMYKKLPPLDADNRPIEYFGQLLHDNCPRRGHFDRGEFLEDWNDPAQRDYCLLLKGCKGPVTYNNCSKVWWNDGANFCVNAGAPCSGCSQPEFYDDLSPLYRKTVNMPTPGVGSIDSDALGKGIAAVAAVGVGLHAAGRLMKARKGHAAAEREEEQ